MEQFTIDSANIDVFTKAKQSWLLDSRFRPHAFYKCLKIFIIWQFAPHKFLNIHKIFIIAFMKFFELFSQDFSHNE